METKTLRKLAQEHNLNYHTLTTSLFILWIVCGAWWVWHEGSQTNKIQELQVLLSHVKQDMDNIAFCLEQSKFGSQSVARCVSLTINAANPHSHKDWTTQSATAGVPEPQSGTVTHTTVKPHPDRYKETKP